MESIELIQMTISDRVILTGYNLTFDKTLEIVSGNKKIKISTKTFEKLKKNRELVLKTKQKVYGLNTGVGQNKDLTISNGNLGKFNLNLIESHSISLGKIISEKVSRMTFLVRINQLLKGYTGINPKIVNFMIETFNLGIAPILHNCGSIGEADIGILSEIGNLVIGNGDIWVEHKKTKAITVYKQKGISPIVLGPKDGLSIVSSNAFGVAQEITAVERVYKILEFTITVFGLTAEGFDMNVTPISQEAVDALNNEAYRNVTEKLKEDLDGSYLFKKHQRKHLQDPISFRSSIHVFSTVYSTLKIIVQAIDAWMVSSDDNPIINSKTGLIISTGNFETLSLPLFLETLNQALGHLSRIIFQQIKHLNNNYFTGLPRFLINQNGTQFGLQTLQKVALDFDIRIRQLVRPISLEFTGLAGKIEDHNSNLPLISETTLKICDYFLDLVTIELYNAVQANYLRFNQNIRTNLGVKTANLYSFVRTSIPPIEEDRNYNLEMENLLLRVRDRVVGE